MVTDIHYYFENMDKFPIEGFFEGMKEAWEPLKKVNEVLDELLVKPNVCEIRGEVKGPCGFYGNYFIDEGTVLYDNVTIMGPVYIGKNCELMPGSIIRPYTILGDGCVVGHCCEIKHTVAMNGAKMQSVAFVGDSVVGKSARVGSGTITANRKFDQSNVTARVGTERIDLGTAFFGCVIGDNSRIGANSVTQPGTFIGPYSWIYPATSLRGFVPRQKRVFQERPLVMLDNEMHELKP